MSKKFRLNLHLNKRLVIVCIAVIVVAGVGFLLYKTTHKPKVATVVPKGPESPQIDNSQNSTQSTTNSTNQAATPTPTPPTDQSRANATLTAPSGQLAGTQKPPSGSAAAVTQGSPSVNATCLTLAGATCVVQLTGPNGEAKTINPSSNDGQGNFVFNWSAAGYSNGTWQVKLIATKDGQTSSANIGPLEVSP